MTNSCSRTTENPHSELPHFQELLDGTDWASLATPYGTGESLPAALTRLLDPNPSIRAAAARDALDAVTHQNTIYEATVPVALYVAAILNHPTITAGEHAHEADLQHHPTRETLLDWLGHTAYDADDECLALSERHLGEGFLDACPDMWAFRDLRPVIYSAVQPFLTDDNARVRDAALVSAIPLTEHHALAEHRNELADHAHRLLSTSTDRYRRDRALDALNAWGHDTSTLENANDIAAREFHVRMADHDLWWASNGTGGCAEDPPF
ncbi:hypothetical protein PUR49_04570 [Streptomyces sp. BE147]|nr:hypothetical protein [Streptomyces sp. BE147]